MGRAIEALLKRKGQNIRYFDYTAAERSLTTLTPLCLQIRRKSRYGQNNRPETILTAIQSRMTKKKINKK